MANAKDALVDRFGNEALDIDLPADAPPVQGQLAKRSSVRKFRPEPVPYATLRRLSALALCSPTKSDLQQRDIVIVDEPSLKTEIAALLTSGSLGQKWLAKVPTLLVFCGNNRRQRRIHAVTGRLFANDHLDAFFNAAVDAAIALSAFVIAAEAEGLGTCPISAIRNYSEAMAGLLHLPEQVFPVAGLAVGYPVEQTRPSMRLPLSATVHRNAYSDADLDQVIKDYDQRRSAAQPYESQRYVQEYGRSAEYGWSEDKARQYSRPERAEFGTYVRRIGFKLD